jgi:lactate permease
MTELMTFVLALLPIHGPVGLALLAGGFNMWWIAAMIWGAAVLLLMSRDCGRIPATVKN